MSDIEQQIDHVIGKFRDGEASLTRTAAGLATVASAGRMNGFPAVGGAATAFAVLALTEEVQRVANALEALVGQGDLRAEADAAIQERR